jgi:hypothetical protein
MIKKIVSYNPGSAEALLTNTLAHRLSDRCSKEMRIYVYAGRPNWPGGQLTNWSSVTSQLQTRGP